MGSVIENLKIAQIRADGGTQPRIALNEAIVAEYGEAITEGAKLPPVMVFHDGTDYWLADGFHRFFAHKNIGALDIKAEVRQGTKRDAVLHSVGANDKHGLRRTNADKRKAIETMLADQEWSAWSDNQIAKACNVSPHTVSSSRKEVTMQMHSEKPVERTYTTRHGTTAVMNTENIGKKKTEGSPALVKTPARTLDAAPLPDEQMVSNDEIAEAQHTITELAAENELLNDRLAVAVMDASDEEKEQAAQTIQELRQRVHVLEQENDALKASRDTYMSKVAEMQKQVNYWRKKAEKVAA